MSQSLRGGWSPQKTTHPGWSSYTGPLAHSVVDFESSGNIIRLLTTRQRSFSITNKGVEMSTDLLRFQGGHYGLELNCAEKMLNIPGTRRCLLILSKTSNGTFLRSHFELRDPKSDLAANADRIFQMRDYRIIDEEVIYLSYYDHLAQLQLTSVAQQISYWLML